MGGAGWPHRIDNLQLSDHMKINFLPLLSLVVSHIYNLCRLNDLGFVAIWHICVCLLRSDLMIPAYVKCGYTWEWLRLCLYYLTVSASSLASQIEATFVTLVVGYYLEEDGDPSRI